jgi:ATP-dependent 26S proteasome regulatory subunit
LTHEKRRCTEQLKENKEKINLNRQLPFLVANVVELLDIPIEGAIDPDAVDDDDLATEAENVDDEPLPEATGSAASAAAATATATKTPTAATPDAAKLASAAKARSALALKPGVKPGVPTQKACVIKTTTRQTVFLSVSARCVRRVTCGLTYAPQMLSFTRARSFA